MNKAVFIDKDGTLIKNVPYNVDLERIALENRVVEALSMLQQNDYLLIVVSNQGGIAKGYFNEKQLMKANAHLAGLLAASDVFIDAFYYCPHHPDGVIADFAKKCNCRKPAPGMLLQASQELQIDLKNSWMIGDNLNDVEAGHLAGCKSVLYDVGNETEWVMNRFRKPDYKTSNLLKAAAMICEVKYENIEEHEPAPESL
ncbi:D,D-heptose 1,7-bisphosphate phosphatase [Filimonas lacunae]|uniref:D,D-heptose 1,7-bisphosphate phosphatase n=1 Tax=Filimonas lacunae TaxID=477680 RepID=A0A173MAI9_9BACT|nr:HAD family hydrolase [Filimonas lacunae]BAV04478.1 D-glycero-D-manno-heptose 1,7-bisphosphate phosphatase [Filimonas lacunae]SIT31536.1 D,D-heptose 1,7-bisphosphate phosphatase [Filimonas lacunae]